jgi:hypothetical protein
MNRHPRYLSFLLRLWQTDDQGQPVWRASLESPGTGQRQGFASPQELFDFLCAQIDSEGPPHQDTRPAKNVQVQS